MRGQKPPFSKLESVQDFVDLFQGTRLDYAGWGADIVNVLTVSWVGCILDDRYINDSEKVKRLKNLLAASSQVIE
ncbi:hypothetical protein ABD86_04245 [Paenibacillus alvei]|uniref:hypothetical protein n=1 Tax=Paenibacillus alvei TaxID=44250 RepID=UPI0022837368|nr:hypothetical protein [Paenibacillus alvei]MBG9734542.1 hypothetical protein [Paenibacillus alvei]MBG9743147.1 hypothetical protein [Paenibacillus alvei]MCY9586502.1 hypothetical protein [Paenibacillus alvei]